MKKLVFKFSLFIFGVSLILISYFTQPSARLNNGNSSLSYVVPDTQFQIGIINDGKYSMYNYIKDSLHLNVWHQYTQLDKGWDDSTRDNYLAPISYYSGIVTQRKGQNDRKGLRTYFDRPTVSYVISGQRTDYECEKIDENSCLYWFNSYNISVNNNSTVIDIKDTSRYGKGERVKQCKTLNSAPESIAGYINTGIRANRNLSYGYTANKWVGDDAWDWYVMPRIRIDSVYAAGTTHNDDVVCRIEITGWDDYVRIIPLSVLNFKSSSNAIYHGNYLEEYFFGNQQKNLIIEKDTIHKYFLPPTPEYTFDWVKNCNVDIKIFWTGVCDMWIDRVRLENEPAHRYLTLNDLVHQKLVEKIDAEITWANNNNKGVPNYFYFEENTLSHFPLIKALNQQIMDHSTPTNSNGLVVWYNDYLVNAQIPPTSSGASSHLTNEQVRTLLIDSCKLHTVMLGWYGFEGWSKSSSVPNRISKHPSSLLTTDYDSSRGILSYVETPVEYDNWLQNNIENPINVRSTMEVNKLMSDLSIGSETQPGLRTLFCPQAHSFYVAGGVLKEPTNEEIELQTNIALMHNTKGIMFYVFDSHGNFSYPDLSYCRGIMDTTGWNYFPQYNNYL